METGSNEVAIWRPCSPASQSTPKRLQCSASFAASRRRDPKWLKYFTLDSTQGIAVCKICGKSISHNHGKPTSNLIKHLKTSGSNQEVRLMHRRAFESYTATANERLSPTEQLSSEPPSDINTQFNYLPVFIHHQPIFLNWLQGLEHLNEYLARIPSF